MTQATAARPAEGAPGRARHNTVTRAGPPIQRRANVERRQHDTSWRDALEPAHGALTMSLSGMFNVGHDIGGFAGPVPDEMLIAGRRPAAWFRA